MQPGHDREYDRRRLAEHKTFGVALRKLNAEVAFSACRAGHWCSLHSEAGQPHDEGVHESHGRAQDPCSHGAQQEW